MKNLLIIISLLSLFSIVKAQEDAIDPRILIPSTSDIFSETIQEIISPRLIKRNFDDTREIYIYVPRDDRWLVFDYPDNMETIAIIEAYSETEYLLHEEYNSDSDIALLNIETGEYSTPELRCGVIVSVVSSTNTWRYFDTGICNTETLEHYPIDPTIYALHEEAIEERFFCRLLENIVTISPKRDYLVFQICTMDENRLYRYDLATQNIELIYSIAGTEQLKLLDWLDNSTLFFETTVRAQRADDYSEPSGTKFYRLDTFTREPQQLGFASDSTRQITTTVASVSVPQLYIMLSSENERILIETYNYSSNTSQTHVDMSCEEVSFECEYIELLDISEDECYFLVFSPNQSSPAHYLFSSVINDVAYSVLEPRSGYSSLVGNNSLYWREQSDESSIGSYIHRVTFSDEGELLADDLFEATAYSHDGRFMLTELEGDNETVVTLFDTESNQEEMIMNLPSPYTVSFFFVTTDLLIIQLFDDGGEIVFNWEINPENLSLIFDRS